LIPISAPALQKHVESPLSVRLLSGEFGEGDTILVDVEEDQNKLVFKRVEEEIPDQEFDQVEAEAVEAN